MEIQGSIRRQMRCKSGHKPRLHFPWKSIARIAGLKVRAARARSCIATAENDGQATGAHAYVHTYILCKAEPEPCRASETTESRAWATGLCGRRRGHLPGNLSCSDYTMCLASLWAILPFCSVKYKRRSGKGKGTGGSRESYQFTTFEFTEPGAGILLYPGCEPSLGGAWIDKRGTGGGKNSSVKERETDQTDTHGSSSLGASRTL